MKIKNINIILLIILVVICIMLLYALFNNKHHELYNEMNKLILKEKFILEDADCMKKETVCQDVPLRCKNNTDEKCENSSKYDEYCRYLTTIETVLKSSCFTCDEKNNIINTAKRVKCLSLGNVIDETTYT